MNNDEIKKQITDKKSAIRKDVFDAKEGYDQVRSSFDNIDIEDYEEEYFRELEYLRHEMKILMSLLSNSKFDEIMYLASNPSKLMGINFIIGFVRGLGFTLALLIILILVFISLRDTAFFYLF